MEEAQSYWRHVWNIAVSAQAELATSAEAQFNKRLRDPQAFADTVASNAPAGSEAAVSAFQTAVAAATQATSATVEASKKAAEQALEIAGNNVNAVASASSRATKHAVNKSRRTRKNECSSTRLVHTRNCVTFMPSASCSLGKSVRSLPGALRTEAGSGQVGADVP
jgi:hypothetical protein